MYFALLPLASNDLLGGALMAHAAYAYLSFQGFL